MDSTWSAGSLDGNYQFNKHFEPFWWLLLLLLLLSPLLMLPLLLLLLSVLPLPESVVTVLARVLSLPHHD